MKMIKKLANTDVVHDYANRCYRQNARIAQDDMDVLRLILEPIYGKL